MAFDNTLKDLEEMGCNAADEIRESLRDSKYGGLKTLLWDAKCLIAGATIGSIARLTGTHGLVAAPLALDALGGGFNPTSPKSLGRKLWGYVEYSVGAAIPYMDMIYESLSR